MSEQKPYLFSTRVLITIILVCALLSFNLIAQIPMAGADDARLSVNIQNNLIPIHAKQANFTFKLAQRSFDPCANLH